MTPARKGGDAGEAPDGAGAPGRAALAAPAGPIPDAEPAPPIRAVLGDRWRGWPVLLAGVVAARILAVVGLRPYVYVDSAEYSVLDFSGRWRRPWATPYLYWLTPGDHRWEIVAQALVGGVAWAVLGLVVAAWFRDRAVGLAVGLAVVALGLTTSITNWDTAILSESLALSLTVLVVAAWLELVRRPTTLAAALVLAATLPWLFTRQSLMPAAWLVVGAAAVALATTWRRRGRWRPLAVVAVGLVLLTGVASYTYGRNQEVVRTNLTVIVANRVAPTPERLDWFRDEGMPTPATGGFDYTSLSEDRSFQRWVAGEGRTTYARYLVTHPWYTLTEPLDDLVSERPSYGDEGEPGPTMLSPADGYGSARPVVPELVEQVLFSPGATGTIVAALALVLGWTVAWWRRRERRWGVPLALVLVSLASLVSGWHGATPELNRLAIVAAVALRVGLLLQLGLLVEAARAGRRDRRRATGEGLGEGLGEGQGGVVGATR